MRPAALRLLPAVASGLETLERDIEALGDLLGGQVLVGRSRPILNCCHGLPRTVIKLLEGSRGSEGLASGAYSLFRVF